MATNNDDDEPGAGDNGDDGDYAADVYDYYDDNDHHNFHNTKTFDLETWHSFCLKVLRSGFMNIWKKGWYNPT